MKRTSPILLMCIITLIACGQTPSSLPPVLKAVSVPVAALDAKSFLYQHSAPDSAIFYATRGLKMAQLLHDFVGEGVMLNRFARINEEYGNFKLAVRYQKEAATLFQKRGEVNQSASATVHLGLLEAKLGNVPLGLQLVQGVLSRYQKNKDTVALIGVYNDLGAIQELGGHSRQALDNYSIAEQLNNGQPLDDTYFDLINKIGGVHARMGNHQAAALYYEKGISKSVSPMHAKAHIAFLNHAGKSWDSLGNSAKAFAFHQEGLQQSKAFGFQEEAARSLIGMAAALKHEDADQSILHLKNALTIADSIGQKQLSAEIYSSLSEIYRQHDHYEDALTALEAHHHLLDSLLLINKGHKIAVLQSSYDLAESKLHVETLELSNTARTNQRNAGIGAAIASLLILLVVGGYFYKTRQLNIKLKESNLVKDKLFSIIGHDLRNPIGGITQLLTMIENSDLPAEKHRPMISAMRKQGEATLDILNALLQWGHAQIKGIQVQPAHFNANQIVAQNIEALRGQAAGKSVVVSDYIPKDLQVFGDVQHFDFVIRNLLSNAIKFSHQSGTIELAVNTVNPDAIVFSVTDHGKGISAEQQAQFTKATLEVTYGTKGEKGTGIGLMLSREFIRANHGKLWLQSEEGKGTTFYFSFASRQAA